MNLPAQILHWGQTAPARLAHASGTSRLTYGELGAQSTALAAALVAQLPADGSPIAMRGHKEPEMLIGFLGAALAGHPYIPLDVSTPTPRVEQILAAANVSLVLTPERIRELVREGLKLSPADVHLAPQDPYYIIFTSGSTGEPKGVVIPLEALTDFVEWQKGEHAFQPGAEIFLNQAPFSFDLSVMDLYLALATGNTLFSITNDMVASPKHLFPALARSGITTWVSTPSFAQFCLAEPTFTQSLLPGVRRFWFCGETLLPGVAAQLLARFPQAQVWNTYGPTEATVATTSIQITSGILERCATLPIGYAKPRTDVFLLDGSGNRVVQEDAQGEIAIAGPNVSAGYLHQPELTARSFFTYGGQRAYRTGDAGHLHDGLLFYDGRLDFQIKLHGYRIELGDIETNLCALPGVRDAVVLPVLKNNLPDRLAALVVLQDPPTDDFGEALRLKQELAARLPAYMVPSKIVFRDSLPMTPNGKIDRRQLALQLA